MTTKAKKDARDSALRQLQRWHEEHGISDFPKRFGLSTNEKKFREISFRAPDGMDLKDVSADDFIVSTEPVYGLGHTLVGRVVTYNVWMPSEGNKTPGVITIRFSFYPSVIGLVKIGPYFVAVEHDNFPLQSKNIGAARMFGVTKSPSLEELGIVLVDKEFPFIKENVKSIQVTQLGNTIYQDPSSRYEETIFLLIEVEVNQKITTKDELSELIDHRNKEMILHHIFDEEELHFILEHQMGNRSTDQITRTDDFRFRDQYSSWILASYFRFKE